MCVHYHFAFQYCTIKALHFSLISLSLILHPSISLPFFAQQHTPLSPPQSSTEHPDTNFIHKDKRARNAETAYRTRGQATNARKDCQAAKEHFRYAKISIKEGVLSSWRAIRAGPAVYKEKAQQRFVLPLPFSVSLSGLQCRFELELELELGKWIRAGGAEVREGWGRRGRGEGGYVDLGRAVC